MPKDGPRPAGEERDAPQGLLYPYAGVAVFPIEPFGLFLEYRFTDFEAEYSDRVGVSNTPAGASPELATHFIQAGLSVRF